MKHDVRGLDEFVGASQLRLSARRTLARTMRRALYAALLIAGAAAAVVAVFHEHAWPAVAIVAAAMLVAGGLAGLLLTEALASAIARLSSRPLELLLTQPGIAEDIASERLNWRQGRALGAAEIEADLAVLTRQVRRAARQSRAAIAELERAREEADQQNDAKDRFIANMSHELRTPLNAILGYAMLLQEDAGESGNATAIADLERIQLAGRNLLTVINDLLDLAKIEEGQTKLSRDVFNVRELAQAAVASCPAARRNGNSFELIVAEDAGIMIGDADKVRQCLINLLSNAFKFTSQGSVVLDIATTMTAGLPTISFSVRDTGIGIAAAHCDHLFEAFSQGEADPGRRWGGTGVGLAITRRLARMMGGECTVESVEGEGSTFCLSLPLAPNGQGGTDDLLLTIVPDRPVSVRISDRCALIVDDDEAALDLTRRWLERMGYNVFGAFDGETGLALAREHKPDLVLLDVFLPRRSGYDVLAELRSDPAIADTPVILVTVDDDRTRGIQAGASEHLRKPVTEEQLRAVVDLYRNKGSGDILVIEDDDDAAELIKRSVEQAGFSSRRARNGLEGLAMAGETRPAAIVLDLAMPVLDGFGVIDRLSTDRLLADIPLIVVSGRDISLSEHRMLAAAGHRFFSKGSASPREIAQSLREMVA